MPRVAARIILDVLLTTALAWLILALMQWLLSGFVGDPLSEAARVLFNFMDVGLGIWVVVLIVLAVRWRRRGGVPAGLTYAFVLVGTVLNLIVVIVVGFVQGGWAPLLVMFAIEAGFAVLIAAAIVVPVVHRLVRDQKPSTDGSHRAAVAPE